MNGGNWENWGDGGVTARTGGNWKILEALGGFSLGSNQRKGRTGGVVGLGVTGLNWGRFGGV